MDWAKSRSSLPVCRSDTAHRDNREELFNLLSVNCFIFYKIVERYCVNCHQFCPFWPKKEDMIDWMCSLESTLLTSWCCVDSSIRSALTTLGFSSADNNLDPFLTVNLKSVVKIFVAPFISPVPVLVMIITFSSISARLYVYTGECLHTVVYCHVLPWTYLSYSYFVSCHSIPFFMSEINMDFFTVSSKNILAI